MNEYCNIVEKFLSADTTTSNPWDQNVKIQLFQNMVMLHIKLKKIVKAASW